MKHSKLIYILTVITAAAVICTTSVVLFYQTDGQKRDIVNQYGDTVTLYGSGLYACDSYFMAPIAKGTDFTFLFVGVPLLLAALRNDRKKQSQVSRLKLLSMLAVFVYYGASVSFGITYNFLHLLYTAVFSLSLFTMILCFRSIDESYFAEKANPSFLTKGLIIFLAVSGASLFIA